MARARSRDRGRSSKKVGESGAVLDAVEYGDMDVHLSSAVKSKGCWWCRYVLVGFENLNPFQVGMALFAAHTFLIPPLLLLLFCISLFSGPFWRWFGIIVTVVYVLSSFDGGERVGERVWPDFIRWWRQTHGFFPVTVKMWDGTAWTTEPNAGHRRVYNVLTDEDLRREGGVGRGSEEDSEGKRFVFGLHPHGPIPLSASVLPPQLARWPWLLRRLRIGVASAVFRAPFMREFYTLFGSVDASRGVLDNLLERGYSIMLLPGGIREQLKDCADNEEIVVLQRRHGFIKLALQHGASLVPIFGFGERKGYMFSRPLRLFSHLLRFLCNAGVPIIRGQWYTLVPFPQPITIVFGKPIPVPQDQNPSQETVAKLHQTYIDAVRNLYETHKKDAGYENVQLKIV